MLRHKALGLCPKARQGREGKRVPSGYLREAQSDSQRTEGKRQPSGLLREAQSDPEA